MNKLPYWHLVNPLPSFHDAESGTVIEMTAKVYGAMNELIKEYNAFAEKANAEIENFQNKTTQEQQEFFKDLIKTNREYFSCMKEYIQKNLPAAPKVTEITLLASGWEGTASPYSQKIDIPCATKSSQIDLRPTVEQLAVFHEKDLAFVTINEDGVITVYAIGQKPTNDYTIHATVTEVTIDG